MYAPISAVTAINATSQRIFLQFTAALSPSYRSSRHSDHPAIRVGEAKDVKIG
jgi:hypothetical protein